MHIFFRFRAKDMPLHLRLGESTDVISDDNLNQTIEGTISDFEAAAPRDKRELIITSSPEQVEEPATKSGYPRSFKPENRYNTSPLCAEGLFLRSSQPPWTYTMHSERGEIQGCSLWMSSDGEITGGGTK
jgi:hypothetical protein